MKRKLLLTGTPIQNDLEELYSLNAFVNPGYLGNVIEFRSKCIEPIMKWKDNQTKTGSSSSGSSGNSSSGHRGSSSSSSDDDMWEEYPGSDDDEISTFTADIETKGVKAQSELGYLLSKVMLQRTQKEVLNRILPPRHDYLVLCHLNTAQKDRYDSICNRIGVGVGVGVGGSDNGSGSGQ